MRMAVTTHRANRLPIQRVRGRRARAPGVREGRSQLGFSLVDQTKIVTAASELARNTLAHGGGGDVSTSRRSTRAGAAACALTFEDQGPGIADVAQAMSDGFTTGKGLGLGLGGARRLVERIRDRVRRRARARVSRSRDGR